MKAFTNRAATCAIVLAGLCGVWLGAATAARAADDEVSKRVSEYYRRKQNIPPEVDVKVSAIKDSPIPGAKSATIEMSRGGQSQSQEILMSADGKYVVFGEVEDVTSDPFAAIAKKIKIDGNPVKGPKDAKVTIVEYSDFQCPYCARAHETISGQVMKEYDGKVRLVHKNFPLAFHKWAEAGSIAGECAFEQDPASFWKIYDYFFDNQKDLTPENVKEKALVAVEGTKVNKEKFNECYDGKKPMDKIKADMAEGQTVGVTGTPAFLINGRKLSGAQPFDRFKAIIDDELARAGKS